MMSSRRPVRSVPVSHGAAVCALALAAAGVTPAAASVSAAPDPEDSIVEVQLLSVSDWHGVIAPEDDSYLEDLDRGTLVGPQDYSHLETPDGDELLVGGGPYLAAHFDRLTQANSIRFAVGDSIAFGSSPDYDRWHGLEPGVEFLNHIGIDFNTIGNHELDRGVPNLLDYLEAGECPDVEPDVEACFVNSQGEIFDGTHFPNLTANYVDRQTREPIAAPYYVRSFRTASGPPVQVGIINLTTARDGKLETQSYHPELDGLDLAETANHYAERLDRRGVSAIVASLHEGGEHEGHYQNCVEPSGLLFEFAEEANALIDAIVGAHTHDAFNCTIEDPEGQPRPVVQGGAYGQLINELTLHIDIEARDVLREETTAVNHPVTRDIEPDPTVVEMADYWQAREVQTGSQPMTEIGGDLTRDSDDTGQSTIGNAVADAMYEDSQLVNTDPADRADLALARTEVFESSNAFIGDLYVEPGDDPADQPGVVLFQEWKDAFGYYNPVLTVTVRGEDLHTTLEDQWRLDDDGEEIFAPFAVSDSVRYSYDDSAPIGERIDPEDILIDGEPLDLAGEYRLAGLTFTIWGRDGTTGLDEYTDGVRGSLDQDVFLDHLRTNEPIEPPHLDRVTSLQAAS